MTGTNGIHSRARKTLLMPPGSYACSAMLSLGVHAGDPAHKELNTSASPATHIQCSWSGDPPPLQTLQTMMTELRGARHAFHQA